MGIDINTNHSAILCQWPGQEECLVVIAVQAGQDWNKKKILEMGSPKSCKEKGNIFADKLQAVTFKMKDIFIPTLLCQWPGSIIGKGRVFTA